MPRNHGEFCTWPPRTSSLVVEAPAKSNPASRASFSFSGGWFHCYPNGTRGACGTCDERVAYAAWPNLTGRSNLAQSCMPWLDELACGFVLTIATPDCGPAGDCRIPIADYGPGAACTNDMAPCNGMSYTRLLDVTPAAFMSFGGSLSEGIRPILVAYTV